MKSKDKNRDPERARARAMSDARCAWRKMDEGQRSAFVEWAGIPAIDSALEDPRCTVCGNGTFGAPVCGECKDLNLQGVTR